MSAVFWSGFEKRSSTMSSVGKAVTNAAKHVKDQPINWKSIGVSLPIGIGVNQALSYKARKENKPKKGK